MTSEREKTWRELIDTLDSYAAACVRIGAASGRAAAGADEFAARDRVRLVALLRAALAASPESPEPRPLDEKHVQYATVSAPLMSAMCMGKWRIGPIIFEAPGGHGSFSAWAILAPWPWLRDGEDTPYTAVERFLAAYPASTWTRTTSPRCRCGELVSDHPIPPILPDIDPGCPGPPAPPPVTPGEWPTWEDDFVCARCKLGMIDHAPHGRVEVFGDGHAFVSPAPPPPVTDAAPCGACNGTGRGVTFRVDCAKCQGSGYGPPVTDAGRCLAHDEKWTEGTPCECGGRRVWHDGLGSTTTDIHWRCEKCGKDRYVDGIDS